MVGKILAWVMGIVITLLYASATMSGIGNLTGMIGLAEAMGLAITWIGWLWLVFGVALPVIVFLLALLIGRGRSAVQRLLVLAAGLCAVAAVQLEVLLLVPTSSFVG